MEELALVINQPDQGKFLEKIGWNKEQIEAAVKEIIKNYEGLTYTEEQMTEAKKDRATLNAMKTEISNRRIEVKKAILAPYDAFEAEVKEVVALIEKPIAMIDEQTKAYEERVKAEKKQKLMSFFEKEVGDLSEELNFQSIFNPKWLNKTASEKSCKDEIKGIIDKVREDVETIKTLVEEKYSGYARDYYFRNNRDLTAVLNEVGRMRAIDRKKEEEAARRAEEEAARKAEQERIAAEKARIEAENAQREQENAQNEAENARSAEESAQTAEETEQQTAPTACQPAQPADIPWEEPKPEEKKYKAAFVVTGTREQILSVRDFMLKNGIKFENGGK